VLERARAAYEADVQPLRELATDRLIGRDEFVARRARLEAERAARASSRVDLEATLGTFRHLADVFDELEDVADRRRLLGTCLNRGGGAWRGAGAARAGVPAVDRARRRPGGRPGAAGERSRFGCRGGSGWAAGRS
jgi:hypothetical protein